MAAIANRAPDAVHQETNVISRFSYAFIGHLSCVRDCTHLMADEHAPEAKLAVLPGFTVKCRKIQMQVKCNSPR